MSTPVLDKPKIVYPDSDGQPMADNTRQYKRIVAFKFGLDELFETDPKVFVAGDLLWYPVEGKPTIRAAPDILVAFGRPKGDRGSYMQWEEDDIAPQVVWEILSPNNRPKEMVRKFQFYERFGVEEYYAYDEDANEQPVAGWLRKDGLLEEIPNLEGWISPRLGIRFHIDGTELELFRPDGWRFATYDEMVSQAGRRAAVEAELRRLADRERQRADQLQQQVERLAERLRSLGVDPGAT